VYKYIGTSVTPRIHLNGVLKLFEGVGKETEQTLNLFGLCRSLKEVAPQ
jgi:hypothetical protein